MKILQILVLILGLAILANAQKTVLTGKVYDPHGALVVKAKITAVNQKSEKFETFTNEDGIYSLNLPYNEYKPTFDFRVAKYDITVESHGFEKYIMKDFKVAGKYVEEIRLDFVLDVLSYSTPIIISTENKIN